MEGRAEFRSPQNISGALHQKTVAAFSSTAEVHRDLLKMEKNKTKKRIKWFHKARPAQSKSPEALRYQIDSNRCYLHKVLVHTLSEAHKLDLCEGVNNGFSN